MILRAEYERNRGEVKWVTKWDANTAYFHAYTNGNKQKCVIPCLKYEQGLLMHQDVIMHHIYSFYTLMGSHDPKQFGLLPDV